MKFVTKRLILKPMELSFADDLVEGLNNLNVSKNLSTVNYPYSKKDAISYIKKSIEDNKKKKNKLQFGIYLKSEKKIIGGFSFSINNNDLVAKGGSWINEKYWRQGYITETKVVIIDYLFNKLKIRKLSSQVYKENIASKKALIKLGYKKEGLLKKQVICKATGKVHDLVVLGLFKEDWLKKRKSLIKRV